MTTESPIDTSDMVAVHEVFRRSLAAAPQLLRSVDIGDDDKVAVVASFFANVLAFLHAHHQGEDELLWPKLLARVADREVVERVAAQHLDVDAAIRTAEVGVGAWAAAPTAGNAAALAAALVELGRLLEPHLDEEEALILPLARVHISAAEWAELPAHGMSSFTGDKPWLVLGLIQEAMSTEQAARMLADMPPAAAQFWDSVGCPQFRSFVATLRG